VHLVLTTTLMAVVRSVLPALAGSGTAAGYDAAAVGVGVSAATAPTKSQ
jgi:hypothetical protein